MGQTSAGQRNPRSGQSDASPHQPRNTDSRRHFLRDSSLLLAGAMPAAFAEAASKSELSSQHLPQTSDQDQQPDFEQPIRLALIGCGQRGTALAAEMLAAGTTSRPVQLVALADMFPDRLQQAARSLKSRGGVNFQVDASSRFVGPSAYRQALETCADSVILAAPPVFRPLHTSAAVEAGKHVFAERSIAVDDSGVERFQRAGEVAERQGTTLVVGFQHRYNPAIRAAIAQVHGGAIGDVQYLRSRMQVRLPRFNAAASDSQNSDQRKSLELRNWLWFQWAGGDPIVEQHSATLDLANWLLRSQPTEAFGLGAINGNALNASSESLAPDIFSQHSIEFTYPRGIRLFSMLQASDCGSNQATLVAHGTRGSCNLLTGQIVDRENELIWKPPAAGNATRQCVAAFLGSVSQSRKGIPPQNDSATAVASTRAALLGRTASYGSRNAT